MVLLHFRWNSRIYRRFGADVQIGTLPRPRRILAAGGKTTACPNGTGVRRGGHGLPVSQVARQGVLGCLRPAARPRSTKRPGLSAGAFLCLVSYQTGNHYDCPCERNRLRSSMDVLPCAYLHASNAIFLRRREHLFFRRPLLPRFANTIHSQLPSPEFPGHTESNNMPNQSHTKAAEHHESAAKSHRAAAEQHGKNDHGKAKEHATQAQQHSKTAREHSEQANTKSHAQK